MVKPEYDAAREERISREVFVDVYTEEEAALCWYYYLENKLNFPIMGQRNGSGDWHGTRFRSCWITGAVASAVSRRRHGRYFPGLGCRLTTDRA
ncbi:MAG: hypothetical protein GVY04_15200 [Cyanobacteria bacterium]|jgi:hypothetical protein|nr:hypothetical protein [Cyanobacteria bacterium GSL.Bin1]